MSVIKNNLNIRYYLEMLCFSLDEDRVRFFSLQLGSDVIALTYLTYVLCLIFYFYFSNLLLDRSDLRLGNDDEIFTERGIDPLHIAASKGYLPY